MSPYKVVYVKCHYPPIEVEDRAWWAHYKKSHFYQQGSTRWCKALFYW